MIIGAVFPCTEQNTDPMERAHAEKQIRELFHLVQVSIRDTDIIGMNKDPQQLERFLVSQENKWNLQLLVRDILCNKAYGYATMIV